jgi:hypothetical protein
MGMYKKTPFLAKIGKNSDFWRFLPIFKAKYDTYNQKWKKHHCAG